MLSGCRFSAIFAPIGPWIATPTHLATVRRDGSSDNRQASTLAPTRAIPVSSVQPLSPDAAAAPDPVTARSGASMRMRRAGFWVRLLAFQIDLLILGMGCLGLLEVLTRVALASGRSGLSWQSGCVLAVMTACAYFIGFESSRWQGTLGKRFLGLVVARRVGGQLSLAEASLRTGAAALGGALLGLSFFAVLVDPLRRAAHDRLTDTLVARWAAAGVLPDSLSRFEGRFIAALSIVLATASAVVVDAALSGPLGTAYQRHQRTARVERALQHVGPLTDHIAAAIQTDRKYPDALDPGLIASVGSAAHAAVAYNPRNGVVTLQLGRTPEGSIATLSLYPIATGSEIAWRCSAFAIPARHLPSTCK